MSAKSIALAVFAAAGIPLLRPAERVEGAIQERSPGPGPHERVPELVRGVPRLAGPAEQLRHAQAVARELWGTRGRERWRLRAQAAEAYRAVRVYFPDARKEGAEAAFRAGELWRAGEEDGRARAEFGAVLALAPAGPFAARAALEIGHVARRAGDLEGALAAYTGVLSDPAAAPERRAEAALAAGRAHADMGSRDLARSLWWHVARPGVEPLLRIAAFDLLARDLVAHGDLEGAAGTLEQCRGELAAAANESTELGERVRSALSAMRAVEELKDAVRRRREGVLIDGRAPRGAE